MAQTQTQARGRRGRAWLMPPGNFAATLTLKLDDPPDQLALRSFVMSMALLHTLSEVTGAPEALSLKWPNDVLLNGGKVAGILLESHGTSQLAIGVGANLAAAPPSDEVEAGATRPVSVTSEAGITPCATDFLTVLAHHYAAEETRFQQEGFAPLRADWLAHAAKLGETIHARLPKETITGRFDGIDQQGNLILHTATGIKLIAAADIYF